MNLKFFNPKNFKTKFQKRKEKEFEETQKKFKEDKIYECGNCTYHQGVFEDGIMRHCKGCGKFEWRAWSYDPETGQTLGKFI